MFLIIGLGNPGGEYKNTRHNVGFIILDDINGKNDWQKSSKGKTLYFKQNVGSEEAEYLKPQTFMNNSGFSVAYARKKHDILPENIIVIHDDIDFPLGKVRISYDRGDGGHNGVKSIMEHLDSKSFIRIRVGVSILDNNNVMRKPNVLGNFSKIELSLIEKEIVPRINSIIKTIIDEGLPATMNKWNTT